MTTKIERKDSQRVVRGKYQRLFSHRCELSGPEWRTTFSEIESVVGFKLPESARRHRPRWANQAGRAGNGHGHALARTLRRLLAGKPRFRAGRNIRRQVLSCPVFVDTNVLIKARILEAPDHQRARTGLESALNRNESVCISRQVFLGSIWQWLLGRKLGRYPSLAKSLLAM